MKTMRAVVLTKTCTPEEMKIFNVPVPEVKPGWVLIKIKAFGLNHSEIILRRHEADAPYINLPRIPGIECVGEIVDASGSRFAVGQRVCALMGGMGRSFDGSYAEYALLPEKNVFSVSTDIDWINMGAVPETWFTAWGSLFDCLQLKPSDMLLVRGGTSALGIASIQIAKSLGCTVLATTRKKERLDFLRSCGADVPLLDDGSLSKQVGVNEIDKVFELVGQTTLAESMRFLRKHGIACCSGGLGGNSVGNFDSISVIPNGVYLSRFYSNYPTQEVMDKIFAHLRSHAIKPVIDRVFTLEEISKAHLLMEQSGASGKLVVTVSE